MIDAFLSRSGIENLKVGSPILSILEAATQSDLRSSQDIFNYLNAISLDRAEGDSLDSIGADEDLPRRGATLSSGYVTIVDSSFTKKTAKVYAGQSAPIVGSATIYADDASTFPATPFDIYIGRGTENYEGPITVTAKTQLTGYWQLTIASGDETKKFHNTNEIITVAQGGTRSINAGTIVQSAAGNAVQGIKFSTLYTAFVPDGETEVSGVQVVAQIPGLSGNVTSGSINSFVSSPFTGATVSNLVPLTNGFDLESDEAYRERIRNARQTKTKGTPLAIEQGVLGISSSDENKTVLSASVVKRQNYPTTLYIDDGSGYEEKYRGVPYETIVASAVGGEKYFQVLNYPVYKALVESNKVQPYALSEGGVLAVSINGTKSEHVFNSEDFVSIQNASAYEVVASINGNESIPFAAKLSNNSSQFKVFAKSDSNEDLAIVAADAIDNDMAEDLGLNYISSNTLLLYKNDKLLSKDGYPAIVYSNAQSVWAPSLTVPATIKIDVDGTGAITYSINNSDFINNNTGFSTVSSFNSLDSWIKVLNKKIPGITAFKSGSQIGIKSNLGTSSDAHLSVSGGTLVVDNFIEASESTGKANDYTFNRNTGQIAITDVLEPGDTLTLGSPNTSGFIESGTIPVTDLSSVARQWYVVDGDAERINTGISSGNTATFSTSVPTNPSGEDIVQLQVTGAPFLNAHIGDYLIVYDSNISLSNHGVFKIDYINTAGAVLRFQRKSGSYFGETVSLSDDAGIVIVRSSAWPQETFWPAALYYTANSFVDNGFNLAGASAYVYRTNKIRVQSRRYLTGGNIALVAQNKEAERLEMALTDAVYNLDSHIASKETANLEYGTPEFYLNTITTELTGQSATTSPLAGYGITSGHHVVFGNPPVDYNVGPNTFYKRSDNQKFHSALYSWNNTQIDTVWPVQEFIANQRFWMAAPYAIGPEDTLGVLVDGDSQSKRYVIPFYKEVRPSNSSYGISNEFTEVGGSSLTGAFGLDYTFTNFAAFMRARTKTHNEYPATIGSTKTVLYRYFRHGADGNDARLRYIYATAPSAATSVATRVAGLSQEIDITLPSGAQKMGPGSWNKPRTKLGVVTSTGTGVLKDVTYVQSYRASSSVSKMAVVITGYTGVPTVGMAVTSAPSGGTGTIDEVYLDVFALKGLLIISGVTGTFLHNDTISYTGSGTPTAIGDGTKFNVHTLTYPASVTDHGFYPGTLIVNNQTTAFSVNDTINTASATFIGVVVKVTSAGTDRYIYNVNYAKTQGSYVGTIVTSGGSNSGTIESFVSQDEFYFSSASGSFISGNKTVFARTAGTVSSAGNDGSYAAVANAGNVYYDENGGFNTTYGTTAIGDLMRLGTSSGVPSIYQGTRKLNNFVTSPTQYWTVSSDTGSVSSVAEILTVNTDDWYFFANGSATATAIASAIHALYVDPNSTSPVDAVAVGDGFSATGIVNEASYDEFPSTPGKSYTLTDGINWIQSVVLPVLPTNNYDFTFKDAVTGTLAINSDWQNEDIRLVPVTALNVTDWLNTQSVSGFSSVAESGPIFTRDSGISSHTLTIGSSGAIQVQDGSANSVSSEVIGSGSVVDLAYGLVEFDKTDSIGLRGGHWVELVNTKVAAKQILDSSTVISSISSAGTITASATPFWNWANSTPGTITKTFQVERQGDYVAYIWTGLDVSAPDFAGIEEGDYVRITSAGNGTYIDASVNPPTIPALVNGVNSLNTGMFRVVRIDNAANQKVFWIENNNAQDEIGTCELWFIDAESAIPGDVLVVNSTALGSNNTGSWVVNSFTSANPGITSSSQFTLNVSKSTGEIMNSFTGPLTLGSESNLFQIFEGAPSKLLKKIKSISPSNTDSTIVQILFDTGLGMNRVSESYGTLIQSKDKLGFDSSSNAGIDGYKYAVGLVSEANKVAYGVESDTSTYPGIVAAGANINIEGPFVKRITCALALRLKTGVSSSDIINRVKSTVASYINGVKIGEQVAISSIVAAAGSVNGVVAVTVLSPEYSPGNDLISVQPYEKALVLNLNSDITISLVNEQ
jgi:uncharacterized phage protein gp47/JayE